MDVNGFFSLALTFQKPWFHRIIPRSQKTPSLLFQPSRHGAWVAMEVFW